MNSLNSEKLSNTHLPNDTSLELSHVSFTFNQGASWALHDISLTIPTGEYLCITGANGSGKTTLARILAALVAPDEGLVRLNGQTVFDTQGAHPTAYRQARQSIAAVFQNPEDQLVSTVTADDIAFGPENLGVPREDIGMRIDTALSAVSMHNHRFSNPTKLSGGQQQRIAIAGMLAMHPDVLVLDEPTAMLDQSSRFKIMEILDVLHTRGVTIIHVTHHDDEAQRAQRVVQLHHGVILSDTQNNNYLPHARASGVHETSNDDSDYSSAADLREFPPRATTSSLRLDSPALELHDVTYRYPANEHDTIRNISLALYPGEVVALSGPNGSGKSTLTRIISALSQATSGEVIIEGTAVHSLKRAERSKIRRAIGLLMQHPERQLFAETVAKDVAFGPENQGLTQQEIDTRVNRALQLLHIEHLAQRSPFHLSGGQQRLVAIAGVLACEPRILIMDEPTAGLDWQARERIYTLISELQKSGVAILLITHSMHEITQIASRRIELTSDGTLISAAQNTSLDDLTLSKTQRDEQYNRKKQFASHRSKTPHANRENNAAKSENKFLPKPHGSSLSRNNDIAQSFSAQQQGLASRNSWLHTLDPRFKIVGFLVLMFSAFTIVSLGQLLCGVIGCGMLIIASKIKVGTLFYKTRVFLVMFILIGALNLIVVRSGATLFYVGSLSITDDGVRTAIMYACRFALVIICGVIFISTTTPTAITDGLEQLLRFTKPLGLHPQEIALVMSLALRFIPTLTAETRSIVNAQSARGGSIETGRLVQRIKAMGAIIVPIFSSAIRHADNLAIALDARCYEEGITRTHWRQLSVSRRDILFANLVLIYLLVLFVTRYYSPI